ncbi:MAG: hypothetical protein GXO74_12315 [Calditrichaeota bacterium]|nr:hypothetical protein [Calditrichota bacterium]
MKPKRYLILGVIITVLIFVFCKLNPFQSGDESRVFNYSAFDSTAVKVVQGWMKLKVDAKNKVSGEWHFEKITNDANAGPQNGSGELVGQIEKNVFSLNLNPNMVDNNVFLRADWNEEKMEGVWQFVGFPGVINQGKFIATANR